MSSTTPVPTNSLLSEGYQGVEKVISKLKFIAKIKDGEKVDMKYLTVRSPSWFTTLLRYINGENRNDTYNYIKNTVNEAFDFSINYSTSHNPYEKNLCLCILNALTESKVGIENIKKTYCEDKMFISKMEALEDTMKAKIEAMSQKIVEPSHNVTKISEPKQIERPLRDRNPLN